MGNRLSGKVAIVTGGASGIGAATCQLFAKEGAKGVVIADINEELGGEVADQIREQGGDAFYIFLDVSEEQQWIDTVAATVERYGRLDVTVNNAGMSTWESRKNVEDTTLAIWNRMHAVNVTGCFWGLNIQYQKCEKLEAVQLLISRQFMGLSVARGELHIIPQKGVYELLRKRPRYSMRLKTSGPILFTLVLPTLV